MRGLIVVLVLLGLIGGGGYAVRTYAPQYLPNEWTSDEILTERLRVEIAKDQRADAFLAKFEQLFPADYNEIMTQLVALYRRRSTEQQVDAFVERYMTSFLQDNKRHVPLAEPAALTELGASIAHVTRVMREDDAQMCGAVLRQGYGSVPNLEQSSPAIQAAFIRVTNAMLDAIASGRRAPTQYAAPTDAQMRAMFNRFEAIGGDMEALQRSAGDTYMRSMPAETVCLMTEQMWTAALQAEDDSGPRFVSHAMRAASY